MLDPEHLRNFLHVIDTGSLSGAAARAHVTQPALSRQIGLLEEEVGTLLFERTGRGMRPTADGRRLEQRTRPLLRELDALGRDFSKAEIAGPLSIAVTPSIGMDWVARLVESFHKAHPAVTLRLRVVLSGVMGENLAQGRFDLGLLYSPVEHTSVVTSELWQEAAFLVTRRTTKCKADTVTMDEVLERPLILPSSQYGIRSVLEREAIKSNRALRLALEVDSVQLAVALTRQGMGDLVMTERALFDLRSRQLRALRIVRPRLTRVAQLASTEAALLRPVVRAFWEHTVDFGG